MRVFIFILISAFGFWNVSPKFAPSNNIAQKDIEPTPTPEAKAAKTKRAETLRVDVFEDNKLLSNFFFRGDLLVRVVSYNTQMKKKDGEIQYFYRENGKFDHIKFSGALTVSEALTEALERHIVDFIDRRELLSAKNILFPLPDLAAAEINSIAHVFSVADNYEDFKTETTTDGNKRTVKFIDFNKNIRFDPSVLTLIVGDNPVLIKNYELNLENNFPVKEIYKTGKGELITTYTYKAGRLTGISYRFTDAKNKTETLVTRFEYKEQK